MRDRKLSPRTLLRFLVAASLIAGLLPPSGAHGPAPDDPDGTDRPAAAPGGADRDAGPAPPKGGDSSSASGPPLTENVTVTATRLPSDPDPVEEIPSQVTVLDREQIERAGVRTLQDLLALETGVVVYDQVGNDVQKTLDFRGFSQGTGTRVYLDGAPLNDTRNNALALELIPLGALERIEISPGSTAALTGGGSEAGVIHLLTRRGGPFGGSLSLAGGTFDATDYSAEVHGAAGRFDFFASGSDADTDGFRQNAGGDLTRLAGTAGVDLGAGRRLALSAVAAASDLGNPGALTAEELASDPSSSPFNAADFSDERLRQASLNYRGPLTDTLSLSANLFARERASEVLSTGRSATIFGGFFLDSEGTTAGSAVQIAHDREGARASNRLIAGLEWLAGDVDALGYFTPPGDPSSVDRSSPASDNVTERRTTAVFVQDLWTPAECWTLLAGARLDGDRVEYRDRLDPSISASRRFTELSLRAGAVWRASRGQALHASYGEAFLPPTTEELFAFPLFFSNPDLEPEDSRSYEIGYRGRWADEIALDAAVFHIDTEDEIVFVPDPAVPFAGANENVGRTRRQGVEVAFRGRPLDLLRVFASLTLTDAEFANGPDEGRDVPLVPGERLAAGIDLDLPARVVLRVDGLFVGEQALDNDPANEHGELDSYTVLNARVGWTLTPGATPAAGRRGIRFFAEARNLLDEPYATRGIVGTLPTTFAETVFLTPAPGRRYLAGATWLF